MRKHLSTIGNSLGLVIEKPILELLNITKDTETSSTWPRPVHFTSPRNQPSVE